MSRSDLIVYVLPIITALIGVYANGRYRDWQDKKARDRERAGLLHIIDAELYENNRLLRGIKKNADLAKYPSQSHLATDAWNQSRARLGESLSKDPDHIFALNRHYALVVRIRATLRDPEALKKSLDSSNRSKRRTKEHKELLMQVGRAEVEGENLLSSLADQALSAGETARHKGKHYIGPLPDYYREDERDSGNEQ